MPTAAIMPAHNANRNPSVETPDSWLLTLLTALLSVSALVFYYRHNAILLYGDAVAHINIARRVFDSRTPGLFQLGTVWLPLPHIVDIPFVFNDRLWQTGIGASIPSMLAYIAGALGVFRLVRGMASRLTAWVAALIYALNPNLIYLQATAMTEPLYLALLIWAVIHFSEFAQCGAADPDRARRALEKCALLVAGAMLVRYDGWFLAALIAIAASIVAGRKRPIASPLRQGLLRYLLLTGAVPILWLAYNNAAYGNPLEFANGPYSVHAIQQRSLTLTWTSYPGEHSPRTAALYFLKISRLNLGEGRSEYGLFTVAFVVLLAVFCFARRHLAWVPLWYPVIVYTACIAWGSLPVYLPQWWPFGYYNVRYGLQMLPAIAIFAALAVEFAGKLFPQKRVATAAILLLFASWGYASVWQSRPITLREATLNGRDRMQFEHQLARELEALPASSLLMMDCSSYSGAVQTAGIEFRRVLRESNPPYWEIALSQPARSADYIIAIDHDPVAAAVHLFPQHLESVGTIGTQPGHQAVIYRSAR
jgi:4-amino-4-deoxy-L-arabinose transferase-like glycosyltransferase